MTLHWWMHWFWVTAQIVVSLTSPTTEMTAAILVNTDLPTSSSVPPASSSPDPSKTQYATLTLARLQQSYRVAKAIGVQPTMNVADATSEAPRVGPTTEPSVEPHFTHLPITVAPGSSDRLRLATTEAATEANRTLAENPSNKTSGPARKKDSKLTRVQAFSKPPRAKAEEKPTTPLPGPSVVPEELTVMPLREHRLHDAEDPNAIRKEQWVGANRSAAGGEPRLAEEPLPHAIATAASILEAVPGDSTRLGRARGTFTSEFQRDQLSSREEQRPESKDEAIKETFGANVTEIATITGSCLAIVILLSTFGSVGFIMYRRRYLNPPQTLNSDKCSNPDSSGYIDDSTIRDNSEEMYSLDNDSFLNSLEAMTIQNYWTDSVKHTKL